MDAPDPLADVTVDLVARFQAGDAAAGEALFARYYPRVRRILHVRFLSRAVSGSEIDDVLQETFLAAVRSIADFQPTEGCGFIHWLARIAEHKVADAVRRERALKRDREREVPLAELVPSDATSAAAFEPARDTTQVSSKVGRREEIRTADACLAQLREDYREVIVLRLLEGCSWKFIAEKLGCPSEDAAIKLFGRARATLASAVNRRKHGL